MPTLTGALCWGAAQSVTTSCQTWSNDPVRTQQLLALSLGEPCYTNRGASHLKQHLPLAQLPLQLLSSPQPLLTVRDVIRQGRRVRRRRSLCSRRRLCRGAQPRLQLPALALPEGHEPAQRTSRAQCTFVASRHDIIAMLVV